MKKKTTKKTGNTGKKSSAPKTKAESTKSTRTTARASASAASPDTSGVSTDRPTLARAIRTLEAQSQALTPLISAAGEPEKSQLRDQQIALDARISSLRGAVVRLDTAEYRAFTDALGTLQQSVRDAQADIASVAQVINAVAALVDAAAQILGA